MLADLRDQLQSTLGSAYTVERELGGGGMARVFLAEDRGLGRRVVVKALPPDLAAGVSVDRFRREIQLVARLQHPHIVPLLGAGEADGLIYYTMPFVEGESLRVALLRTGAMPIARATSIIRDVAKALEFAHDKGVVHRDIKPDNILLAGNTAAVADFGIAKAIAAAKGGGVHPDGTKADDASESELTVVGTAIGTPQYMAPEQIAADPSTDHRADLYSLGCVAYEVFVGEPPFAGVPPAKVFAAHLVQPPVPIAERRADVPKALCALIGRCLEKNPDHRPASAGEIIALLDDLTAVPTASREVFTVSEIPSVVVLPFVNLSPDPENEHFADGLTDEVITDLSMIKTLRVISRQSAMRLKGTTKDVRTIAAELSTRYALTGSVRRAGANLRITAQLVDARIDAPLWAEKFSGTIDDVFDIQERLSRQIVDALRLRLTPAEDRQLGERPIPDVRAYEYYLLARQQIWSFSRPALNRALQLVRQAREIVGDNELLLAAEGLIYWQSVNVGIVPVEQYAECLQNAQDCVERIFRLNPDSPKGYSLRGAIRNNRADPSGAMQDFKRALALDPNDPESLLWLGYLYAVSGRVPLARAVMDRLQHVDPLTSINASMYAIVALMEGRLDEALRWTQRSVEIDVGNPTGRMLHALMLAANGRAGEAIQLLEAASREAPPMAWTRLAAVMASALRGDRSDVLRLMTPDLRSAAWWDDIFCWWTADCHALVGETDAALDFVERAIELGIVNEAFFARHEPFLGSIRGEARFGQLMEHARQAAAARGSD